MVLVNNNLKMIDAPHGCSRCCCCPCSCSCSCRRPVSSLPPRSGERSDAVEHVLFVLFITVDFHLTDSRSPSSPPAAIISTYKVAAAAARCLSIVAHRILYVDHTRKKWQKQKKREKEKEREVRWFGDLVDWLRLLYLRYCVPPDAGDSTLPYSSLAEIGYKYSKVP